MLLKAILCFIGCRKVNGYAPEYVQCILLSIVIIGQIKLHQQNRYLSQLEGKYLETEKIKDLFQKIIGNFYTFEGQFEQNYSGKDENGNNSNLSGLINNEQTVLIFKYKSTDCSLCIEKVYEQIQNTPLNIKILFISDFQNFTSMKYIKEKYNLKNVMFLRIEDMPNTTITPCVYLIDKDLKITHFLSIATNDIILPSYLKQINLSTKIITN